MPIERCVAGVIRGHSNGTRPIEKRTGIGPISFSAALQSALPTVLLRTQPIHHELPHIVECRVDAGIEPVGGEGWMVEARHSHHDPFAGDLELDFLRSASNPT